MRVQFILDLLLINKMEKVLPFFIFLAAVRVINEPKGLTYRYRLQAQGKGTKQKKKSAGPSAVLFLFFLSDKQ